MADKQQLISELVDKLTALDTAVNHVIRDDNGSNDEDDGNGDGDSPGSVAEIQHSSRSSSLIAQCKCVYSTTFALTTLIDMVSPCICYTNRGVCAIIILSVSLFVTYPCTASERLDSVSVIKRFHLFAVL